MPNAGHETELTSCSTPLQFSQRKKSLTLTCCVLFSTLTWRLWKFVKLPCGLPIVLHGDPYDLTRPCHGWQKLRWWGRRRTCGGRRGPCRARGPPTSILTANEPLRPDLRATSDGDACVPCPRGWLRSRLVDVFVCERHVPARIPVCSRPMHYGYLSGCLGNLRSCKDGKQLTTLAKKMVLMEALLLLLQWCYY